MGERIHADEADTGEAVVRQLLDRECPEWASLPLQYLRTSGTDNATWRAGDVVVRLPRHAGAEGRLGTDLAVLAALAGTRPGTPMPFRVPTVRHVGAAHDDVYPHRWAVLDWLEGVDAWTARDVAIDPLELAEIVRTVGAIRDVPAPRRTEGERGGPLEPLVAGLERGLANPKWNAAAHMDVDAVLRIAAEGLEVPPAAAADQTFLHGDLIPGNLLLDPTARVVAVIDWGMAGWGDPAQDLAPAWAVIGDPAARRAFRAATGADDATWIRGRTIELIHAVGAVLYYVPLGHPLGDVMARTLGRILDDR